MTHTPQNSDEVADAIGSTLDAFVKASSPRIRRVTEDIYEHLLNDVQNYLRDNAEWNIGAEIDRCRVIEVHNLELRTVKAELLDALDVFSDALGNIADTDRQRWPDNETIEHSGAAEKITWGDLRRARAVVVKAKGSAI